jgi:hypothetical protein
MVTRPSEPRSRFSEARPLSLLDGVMSENVRHDERGYRHLVIDQRKQIARR